MEADSHLDLLYCATADSVEKAKLLPCDRSIVQSQYCPTILSVTVPCQLPIVFVLTMCEVISSEVSRLPLSRYPLP